MSERDRALFALWVAGYNRLRDIGSACLNAGDDDGFNAAFAQAEKVRDLIFATAALTRADAVLKARFLAQIAQERECDLTGTRAMDAILDLGRFVEGAANDG
ncbi:hypothetical protein ACO2Q3_00910 [Caulobacter sp. KR2-114]|uniref:hypothetical protein n=1 Tax=Caulobacter sp. KR2-114 TaxID=3400912 RepID=UPI003C07C914